MTIEFKLLDTRYTSEALGFIPTFFSPGEEAPAAEQLNRNYQHGGGWRPMKGWSMGPVGEMMFEGDPQLNPIAVAALHDEIIRIYPNAWVSITQPDGRFEMGRVD